MKQAVFLAPGQVVIKDVAQPVRGDGQVLVAVGACGLCTWEQRVFRGVRPEYPLLGGHEVGGIVVDTPGGCDISVGEVVAVSLVRRCGRCRYCLRGLNNLCTYVNQSVSRSAEPSGPGGLAEILAVPRADVYPMSPAPDFDRVAIVEPVACVLRSLARADTRCGDTVAVFGLGFMGQLHLMCARRQGCRTIGIATDDRPPPEFSSAGRPDELIRWLDYRTRPRLIAEAAGDLGVDAAFCTRGGVASIDAALGVVRPGGSVVLFESIRGDRALSLDAGNLRSAEILVGGSLSHSRENFAAAARLVSDKQFDLSPLIGRTFGLDQIVEALQHAIDHPGVRTLVHPVSFGGT